MSFGKPFTKGEHPKILISANSILPKIEVNWEFHVQTARFFLFKYNDADLHSFIFDCLTIIRMLERQILLTKEDWHRLTKGAAYFTEFYDDEGLTHFIRELFETIERLYDKIKSGASRLRPNTL